MRNIILYVALPVVGIVLGWTIRWLYARFQLSASEQRAERIKQDAIKEAEAQKNIEEAEKCYLKALELKPEDINVRLELADLYIEKEDII